jgi:hypothetical protein
MNDLQMILAVLCKSEESFIKDTEDDVTKIKLFKEDIIIQFDRDGNFVYISNDTPPCLIKP